MPAKRELLGARRAVRKVLARVVAAGGDGTVNHVAKRNRRQRGFAGISRWARSTFSPWNWSACERSDRCWEIIQAGNTRSSIYRARMGKYFVQLGGIGLDAQAAKKRLLLSSAVSAHSVTSSPCTHRSAPPPKLLIESEDAPVQEGSFVLVGNGRLTADLSHFSSRLLSMRVTSTGSDSNVSVSEILKYLHDVVFSSDIRDPEIEYFQTRQLRVSSEQNVPVELDGELAGNCPVDFQMHEKALPVLSPPASP